MDITFIVIGYNEALSLSGCMASIRHANLKDISYELIYVDGGSEDDSVSVVEHCVVDKILGGEKRRKAAENRNLGLKAAQGEFIQFLDGDMKMNPDWPSIAIAFLKKNKNVAAVSGILKEVNPSAFYRALQMDWQQEEGEVYFCGGAALWRKNVLDKINGFPENVDSGEEPYLCWKVRNTCGLKIYYLDSHMADHDLNYSGFKEYWHRNVRCGKAYVEIASRCYKTRDKFWLRETLSNLIWACIILGVGLFAIFGSIYFKTGAALFLLSILLRKSFQVFKNGTDLSTSLIYGLHIYFSKVAQAFGELSWLLSNFKGKKPAR